MPRWSGKAYDVLTFFFESLHDLIKSLRRPTPSAIHYLPLCAHVPLALSQNIAYKCQQPIFLIVLSLPASHVPRIGTFVKASIALAALP